MRGNRQQRRSKVEPIKGLPLDSGTRVPYSDVSEKAAKPNDWHSNPKKVKPRTNNK